MTTTEINTMNVQLAGAQGDSVVVMIPRNVMTPDEALLHAAWLVQIADVLDPEHSFDDYLQAVRNT